MPELPRYMPLNDFLDYLAMVENATMSKSILDKRVLSWTIDTGQITRCGPPVTKSYKGRVTGLKTIAEEPTAEDIAESKIAGKNYYIPASAIVGVRVDEEVGTVLKTITFLKQYDIPRPEGVSPWVPEEEIHGIFSVLIELPGEEARRATRSMPPSMGTYLGVPEDSTARVYRQKSTLHKTHRHRRR